MFFVLSKTLNFLATPLTIICLCLLVSAFIKNVKWKKKLFWTGVILLFFFSNDFIANACMHAWEIEAKPFNTLRKYKLGIVLTGATVSLKPDDRVYFVRGADRVTHTVQLYKLGFVEKILISGGSGRLLSQEEPEADQFKKAMILMGIPEEAIIIENETRNTYESAVQVKKLLRELGYQGSDCLLITSAFHMRRSLACYRKAGLEPDTFSTDFYSRPSDYYIDSLLVPNINALVVWHKLMREWMGFVAYKVAGYI
jgi:uncharacterized SAM-binding protein YcdF (DUF218 family)